MPVRDTVSSVGIFRGPPLPLTDSAEHVCFFRHALALDERRVKFLPEYVHSPKPQSKVIPKSGPEGKLQPFPRSPLPQETEMKPTLHNTTAPTPVKEVWFAGCHSDV